MKLFSGPATILPDEVIALNRRMYDAFHEDGDGLVLFADGLIRHVLGDWEWFPATDIGVAMRYRPKGWAVQVYEDDAGCACDLFCEDPAFDVIHTVHIEPAAAVCIALLAYAEAEKKP